MLWRFIQAAVIFAFAAIGSFTSELIAPGDDSVHRGGVVLWGFAGVIAAFALTYFVTDFQKRRDAVSRRIEAERERQKLPSQADPHGEYRRSRQRSALRDD